MKTLLCILLSLPLTAAILHADVSITWNGANQINLIDGITPIPSNSLAQLIWVGGDGMIDPIDNLDPSNPKTVDDEVIATHNAPMDGFITPGTSNAASEASPWLLAANSFANSSVYIRIFNAPVPMAGTEWGNSAIFGLTTEQTGSQTPDIYDPTGGVSPNGFQLTSVVVPEPSSYALLLFAAALFFHPWRFRKDS